MQLGVSDWNRQHNSIVFISKDGNITEDKVIKDDEEIVIQKKKKNPTDKQRAFLRDKVEINKYTNSLGGYVHMFYVKNELLFNNINLDRSNVSRLIYLSTYIDYNNRDENLLVVHTRHNKVEPMSKDYMKKILKLSSSSFSRFIKDISDNNLLFDVNDKFYISNEYFSKGKHDMVKNDYTRIFIDTTRFLYENTSCRQHKQLSYAYQLIPLIHFETNVICKNPDELNKDNIIKMSLVDICKFLNISLVKSSMSTFENSLYKLVVKVNGKKYHVFKRIIIKGGNGKFDYFVINPNVIWSGSDLDSTKEILDYMIFND